MSKFAVPTIFIYNIRNVKPNANLDFLSPGDKYFALSKPFLSKQTEAEVLWRLVRFYMIM